mmetsp:Transcript_27437/g.64006  ORF Transcript_27437/g.64006 Transcript_27437/m.64006 type:complete len:275 (-) Transcript_27437:1691-2515(-)
MPMPLPPPMPPPNMPLPPPPHAAVAGSSSKRSSLPAPYASSSGAGAGRQCSGTGCSAVCSCATAHPLVTDGATTCPLSEMPKQTAARSAAVSAGSARRPAALKAGSSSGRWRSACCVCGCASFASPGSAASGEWTTSHSLAAGETVAVAASGWPHRESCGGTPARCSTRSCSLAPGITHRSNVGCGGVGAPDASAPGSLTRLADGGRSPAAGLAARSVPATRSENCEAARSIERASKPTTFVCSAAPHTSSTMSASPPVAAATYSTVRWSSHGP